MNEVIQKSFNNLTVSFTNTAYIQATEIAQHFGKLPKDYLINKNTQSYIKALENKLKSDRGNLITEQNQLVMVKKGGNQQGTWLHPKLAIDFARWLSPEFAVWCDAQIEQILYKSNDTMPVLQPQYPPPRPTVTVEQQDFIRAEVAELSKRTGENPHSIYRRLKLFIGVGRYANIPFDDFERAIAFLHGRCYPPKYIIWEGQNNEPPENLTPLLHCSLLLARVWLETLRYPLCKLNPDANRISEFAKTVVITSQLIAKKYDIDMNVTDSLQFISEPFKH